MVFQAIECVCACEGERDTDRERESEFHVRQSLLRSNVLVMLERKDRTTAVVVCACDCDLLMCEFYDLFDGDLLYTIHSDISG